MIPKVLVRQESCSLSDATVDAHRWTGVLPVEPYLPVAAAGSTLNLELWILGPVELFPLIKWTDVGLSNNNYNL